MYYSKIMIGSPKYMAPELLEERDDYTAKVDIWALGWTFFEIIYGTDPWPMKDVRSMVINYLLMIIG